jgi:hypothetical protein
MKQIQVETFEQEDSYHGEASQMVADVEAIKLIDELGLEGQKELCNPEKQTRSPFRVMTREELAVYQTICPEVAEVNKYKNEAIPLRVLQVLAYAKSEECPIKFNKLQIWSVASAVIKDPLLVGVVEPRAWEYHYYLLARWGEELDSFSNLLKKALEIKRAKRLKALKKVITECNTAIATIDEFNDVTAGTPDTYNV